MIVSLLSDPSGTLAQEDSQENDKSTNSKSICEHKVATSCALTEGQTWLLSWLHCLHEVLSYNATSDKAGRMQLYRSSVSTLTGMEGKERETMKTVVNARGHACRRQNTTCFLDVSI